MIYHSVTKSGTNILIYAYGPVDPDSSRSAADINYHEERRGTRILPLRSYSNQATDDKLLADLDYFDFRLDNVRRSICCFIDFRCGYFHHLPSDSSG